MSNVSMGATPQIVFYPSVNSNEKNEVGVKNPDNMKCMSSIGAPKMLAMNPKEAMEWVGVASAVAALIEKYGPGVIDFIKDVWGSKEQPQTADADVGQNNHQDYDYAPSFDAVA